MTRKHFEAFAYELKHSDKPWPELRTAAELFIRMAKQFNPRFDSDRFLRAAGLERQA